MAGAEGEAPPAAGGPERLGEILARLFSSRAWGRRQEQLRLEEVWRLVAGPQAAAKTRLAGLRRGVLEVVVADPVLLQELAHFHRRRLSAALEARLGPGRVKEIRFRLGAT